MTDHEGKAANRRRCPLSHSLLDPFETLSPIVLQIADDVSRHRRGEGLHQEFKRSSNRKDELVRTNLRDKSRPLNPMPLLPHDQQRVSHPANRRHRVPPAAVNDRLQQQVGSRDHTDVRPPDGHCLAVRPDLGIVVAAAELPLGVPVQVDLAARAVHERAGVSKGRVGVGAEGAPRQTSQYVDGLLRRIERHQQVDVFHRPQPHILVIVLRQRHTLEQHGRDAGGMKRRENRTHLHHPTLIGGPGVAEQAFEAAKVVVGDSLGSEVVGEHREQSLSADIDRVHVDCGLPLLPRFKRRGAGQQGRLQQPQLLCVWPIGRRALRPRGPGESSGHVAIIGSHEGAVKLAISQPSP